jgi:ring-1,2-phenylacetyl-CoA epoxidase subunit PaaC
MDEKALLLAYVLRLGDNSLILGQRLSEWCGHGPVLEQDIALTNIALDLFGQTRSLLQYAAVLEGKGRTEDDLAFLRDVREFTNCLLVEQPNVDFAYTIVRQFFFDTYHFYLLSALQDCSDTHLAAIAKKSLKEVTYHLRFSSEWMIRLGDGTEVSHQKMQQALDDLWPYTGELYTPDETDLALSRLGIAPDLEHIRSSVLMKVVEILDIATLRQPGPCFMHTGGKTGRHTEHLGHLLSEMQFMQRAYPGLAW